MLTIEQKIEMEKMLNEFDDSREWMKAKNESHNDKFIVAGWEEEELHRPRSGSNYVKIEEPTFNICEDCDKFFKDGQFCKKCSK